MTTTLKAADAGPEAMWVTSLAVMSHRAGAAVRLGATSLMSSKSSTGSRLCSASLLPSRLALLMASRSSLKTSATTCRPQAISSVFLEFGPADRHCTYRVLRHISSVLLAKRVSLQALPTSNCAVMQLHKMDGYESIIAILTLDAWGGLHALEDVLPVFKGVARHHAQWYHA